MIKLFNNCKGVYNLSDHFFCTVQGGEHDHPAEKIVDSKSANVVPIYDDPDHIRCNLYLKSMKDEEIVEFVNKYPINSKESWVSVQDFETPEIDDKIFADHYKKSHYNHLKHRLIRKAIALPCAYLSVVRMAMRLFASIFYIPFDKSRNFQAQIFYAKNNGSIAWGHILTLWNAQEGLKLIHRAKLEGKSLVSSVITELLPERKLLADLFEKRANKNEDIKEQRKKAETDWKWDHKNINYDQLYQDSLPLTIHQGFFEIDPLSPIKNMLKLNLKCAEQPYYILDLIRRTYRVIELVVYTDTERLVNLKYFILQTKLICMVENDQLRQILWDYLTAQILIVQKNTPEAYEKYCRLINLLLNEMVENQKFVEIDRFCQLNLTKSKITKLPYDHELLGIYKSINKKFKRLLFLASPDIHRRLNDPYTIAPSLCKEICEKNFLAYSPKSVLTMDANGNQLLKTLLLLHKYTKLNQFAKPIILNIFSCMILGNSNLTIGINAIKEEHKKIKEIK